MENNKLRKINLIKIKTIELLLNSSVHGLPNIFKTKSLIRKILWIFLIVIFSSFGIYMIIINIFDYLEYEVFTKIVIVNESPTYFPTVTFYNLKNFRTNYSLKDILIKCDFNDLDCDINDFEELRDEFGSVYYQYNNGRNSSHHTIEFKKAYKAGKVNGLRIKLFAGLCDDGNNFNTDYVHSSLNEYLPSDGFHVFVHNYTDDPLYSSSLPYDGIDISVGFETSITVDRVFTYNLPKPYNNCYKNLTQMDSFDSDLYRFIINSTGYSYRQKDCFEYCNSNYLIKKCNMTNKFTKQDVVYYLSSKDDITFNCIYNYYIQFLTEDINMRCVDYCPLECDSIKYHLSTSFAKFPSMLYANELLNNSKIRSKFPSGYNVTYNDLSNTMIAFNVYYNELGYTKITQLPKTLIIYLVAAVGGLLGLSIGVSCMSFAEIFQLIFEYLVIILDNVKIKKIKIDTQIN